MLTLDIIKLIRVVKGSTVKRPAVIGPAVKLSRSNVPRSNVVDRTPRGEFTFLRQVYNKTFWKSGVRIPFRRVSGICPEAVKIYVKIVQSRITCAFKI